MNAGKRKTEFTLLELLIVIAIIAILAGILLPALNSARLKAKETDCTGRKKQLAQMAMLYSTDNGDYICGSYFRGSGGGAMLSGLLRTGYVQSQKIIDKLALCSMQERVISNYTSNGNTGPTTGFYARFTQNYGTPVSFKLNQITSPSLRPHISDTRGGCQYGGIDGTFGFNTPDNASGEPNEFGFWHGMDAVQDGTSGTTKILGKGKAVLAYLDGHTGTLTRASFLTLPPQFFKPTRR